MSGTQVKAKFRFENCAMTLGENKIGTSDDGSITNNNSHKISWEENANVSNKKKRAG